MCVSFCVTEEECCRFLLPCLVAHIHVHISRLQLSNKSQMLIQSAGQPQEMSVCVLTNDVSPSLSNAIQFFPLSSFDRPASFLYDHTSIHLHAREQRAESSLITRGMHSSPVTQLGMIYMLLGTRDCEY